MGTQATLMYGALGGRLGDERQPVILANVFKPLSALNTNAEITAWTPASGKKFRLMGMALSAGTAGGTFVFKDNTGGTTLFTLVVQTTATVVVKLGGNGILSAAANNLLTITGPLTSTLTGTIWGTEE